MISVNEALEIMLGSVKPNKRVEEVSIVDALDRILAEDVYSGVNIPSFNNSAMDGYAVRAKDTKGASPEHPVILRVIEDLPAGYVTTRKIAQGQAVRIMTGAPVPAGADAVLMKEYTERGSLSDIDKQMINVFREAKQDDNIRYAGEDVSQGQLVLKKGKVIGPADIGMLAGIGRPVVMVAKQPVVAILTTGDELVGVEDRLEDGKIRDINSYTLISQVKKCGAVAKQLGICPDNKDEIKARIQEGLFAADMLITTGGVSVGDYDFVREILDELGAEIKVYKVAIKPGKPMTFASLNNRLIFGLPGNVVASMVCFEKFVRPVILRMMDATDIELATIVAELRVDIEKNDKRRHFVRARVINEDGKYYALPTKSQSSGGLMSMTIANGLIVVPEGVKRISAGEMVQVEMLTLPRVVSTMSMAGRLAEAAG